MKIKSIYINYKFAILAILAVIISFPPFSPSFGGGIDPSLTWVFNYIIGLKPKLGEHIIFPHGPLAFLMYPVPIKHNWPISLAILTSFYTLFSYFFLLLGEHRNPKQWFTHTIILIILLRFLNVLNLVLALIAIFLLLHHYKKKLIYLYTALFFCVLGIYIKATIGITGTMIIFSYCLIHYWATKKYSIFIHSFVASFSLFLIIWMLLYHNPWSLFQFIYGMLQLAGDNSTAVSYYPDINWYLILTFIIALIAFPFVSKNKHTWLVCLLLALASFAMWKHGMSRLDNSHIKGFFNYIILFLSLLFIVKKFNFWQFIIGIFIIVPMYISMKYSFHYSENTSKFINIHNLLTVLDYKNFRDEGWKRSNENIAPLKIHEGIKKFIGDGTIDIYPWNYGYIPANDFNWKPRPVIQSYASYTSWLDKQNAKHFASTEAPDYILWEMLPGRYQDQLSSLDHRYLLNDEPQSIMQIINNYNIIYKNDQYALLYKSKTPNITNTKAVQVTKCKWQEWISAPTTKDGIVRAKVRWDGTVLKSIKSFLYKDEEYFIEYLLESGEKRRYKIIPKNAADGIWVQPYIENFSSIYHGSVVKSIRFICSNYAMVKNDISIIWEHSTLASETLAQNITNKYEAYQHINEYFGKTERIEPKMIFSSRNDFKNSYSYWSKANKKYIKKGKGEPEYEIAPLGYSPAITLPYQMFKIDTNSHLRVSVGVYAKVNRNTDAALVISLGDTASYFWEGADLIHFMEQENEYTYISLDKNIVKKVGDHAQLTVYIWNKGIESILIKDFQVKVSILPLEYLIDKAE